MDNRVFVKLSQLVKSGVRRLPELRRHLQHYVQSDLFAGRTPPPHTDARYWPNREEKRFREWSSAPLASRKKTQAEQAESSTAKEAVWYENWTKTCCSFLARCQCWVCSCEEDNV